MWRTVCDVKRNVKMHINERYFELLNECFNKPPRTTVAYVKNYILDLYDVDVVTYAEQAYCLVVEMSDGIYEVGWVVVDPRYQGNGFGRSLLEKVHNKYRGIFITKAMIGAKGFYEKVGYKSVYDDDKHSIMIFVNDKKGVKI